MYAFYIYYLFLHSLVYDYVLCVCFSFLLLLVTILSFEGSETWTAACHISESLNLCVQPLLDIPIRFNEASKLEQAIIPVLWLSVICEHKDLLSDPVTELAHCVHNRMLTDDILRCNGFMSWLSGNMLLAHNKYLNTWNSLSEASADVFNCIYEKGNWKHACGRDADAMMLNLTKKLSKLAETYPTSGVDGMNVYNMCDICQFHHYDPKIYEKLDDMRYKLLRSLLLDNQSPVIFKECHLVDYPLNHCHLREVWRRDVFEMFCHQVITDFERVAAPYLPQCDIGRWLRSAKRICGMGYQKMMDNATHIPRCTNNQDELFSCYKGIKMNFLIWGMVSGGRMWPVIHLSPYFGARKYEVYQWIKFCSKKMYDVLSQTCRGGPAVVELIQDLRIILRIDVASMFSDGFAWEVLHKQAYRWEQVGFCGH